MHESVLLALIAGATSSGLCSLIIFLIQRRDKKKGKRSAETEVLLGLGHDRIVYLGGTYVKRGYITQDEYENLYQYLFKPYERLGGNGTASRVMREVEKLPIR
jgi:hypothetical protein